MPSHYELALLASKAYSKPNVRALKVEAYVHRVVGSHETVIAVAGTEDRFDVLRDLWIRPDYEDGVGHAHVGFLEGARGVLRPLLAKVDEDSPLILTGHSMGGAISLILALMLTAQGHKVIEWVGFGTPKCLTDPNPLLKCTDYRNGNDIVSEILPLGFLYQHPVEVTEIGKAAKWWPNFKDHSLKRYIEALGASTELGQGLG